MESTRCNYINTMPGILGTNAILLLLMYLIRLRYSFRKSSCTLVWFLNCCPVQHSTEQFLTIAQTIEKRENVAVKF